MNTFGKIKTMLEEASVVSYKKNEFSKYMTVFKNMVLENKDICELYYIYDDLSTNKGLDRDIADDYINENVEYSKVLISENQKSINVLSKWLENIVESTSNNYSNIDTLIYNDSIKNLEKVLESKKQIKNVLIKESVKIENKETINMPLQTMVKMYESTLKNNVVLNENEIKEISELKSLSKDDIEKEISELKESVISKLKVTLNESKDGDLNSTINDTISKISNTEVDHYNLYKLRKLNGDL
jgi:hypothetical protein